MPSVNPRQTLTPVKTVVIGCKIDYVTWAETGVFLFVTSQFPDLLSELPLRQVLRPRGSTTHCDKKVLQVQPMEKSVIEILS